MQRGESAMQDLCRELESMKAPYLAQKFLSSGSYGAVCAGIDKVSGKQVAIKRVFTTVSDGRQVDILSDSFLGKRVLREVKLLCHFHHPNILGLLDVMLDKKTVPTRPKLYLVTELMKTDLAQVIADSRITMTAEHIRFFMYNTFLGLRALHQAGVVHRDLHPGNILLSDQSDVKICDFNLAREDTLGDGKTHYVTHRWYRAPELVMQFKGFTKVVDLWSAGCIMGELYNRKALFRGSTFYNQLNRIVEIVGTPNGEDVAHFASNSAREYLRASLANVPTREWSQVVPTADPIALDLLSKLLQFNPAKRITAEDALRHPYFQDLFDASDLDSHEVPFHFDEKVEDVNIMHQMLNVEVDRFDRMRRGSAAASNTSAGGGGGSTANHPPAVAVTGTGGGSSSSAAEKPLAAPVAPPPSAAVQHAATATVMGALTGSSQVTSGKSSPTPSSGNKAALHPSQHDSHVQRTPSLISLPDAEES